MELKNKIFVIQNLIRSENFSTAIVNCKKLLKKYPENSYTHNLCGLALQGEKRFSNSIEYFSKALHYDPENLAAMNNLANSYKTLYYYDKAQDLYLKIIKKDPLNLKTLNNYANLKRTLNDFDGAIDLYLKATKIDPEEMNILFSLADSYQSIGDFKKSREVADRILRIDPNKTSAHKLISGFTNYHEGNKEHLDTMKNLSSKSDLTDNQKIDLFFALGKAHEDLKDFDGSFQYLEKANFLKKEKSEYKIQKDEKIFNNIIKTFDEIDFYKFKKISSEKKIIFICGMPRSGTTLTEQIIAAHNLVGGAGELVYLQTAIKNIFFEDLNLNKQKIIEEGLGSKNTLENDYLKFLDLHKLSSGIITDKAPQNFRWIGFMKIFFPNCKVINCTRDSKDNCLSIFKNAFASKDMDWSHSQKDIGEYYNLYLKLMDFWKKKIPEFIYEVKYEAIVSNPEDEIKKLLNFCNLKWDPDCLNFHKNKKTPIQTVSVSQARKPIYKSSINSNIGYSNHLQEMYKILDTH
jgi:Flp pilus assembly protein TadD